MKVPGGGAVEGVRQEGSDGAENKRREVEDAGGENLRLPGRESGGTGGVMRRREHREEWVELEILERVSPLVELEP